MRNVKSSASIQFDNMSEYRDKNDFCFRNLCTRFDGFCNSFFFPFHDFISTNCYRKVQPLRVICSRHFLQRSFNLHLLHCVFHQVVLAPLFFFASELSQRVVCVFFFLLLAVQILGYSCEFRCDFSTHFVAHFD